MPAHGLSIARSVSVRLNVSGMKEGEKVRERIWSCGGDKRRGSSRLRRRGATGRIVNHELLLNAMYDLVFASGMYWPVNKLSAAPHKSKPISHTMNHTKLSNKPLKKKKKKLCFSQLAVLLYEKNLSWERHQDRVTSHQHCIVAGLRQKAREAGDCWLFTNV